MTDWDHVRAAVADGLHRPVRATVTAYRNSRVSVVRAIGTPFVLWNLVSPARRVLLDGRRVRVEDVDGTPLWILGDEDVWDFTEDPACPVATGRRYAHFFGPGAELVMRTPGLLPHLDEFFGGGTVTRETLREHEVWVVTGTVNGDAARLTVDVGTGVPLAVSAVDDDWSAELLDVDLPGHVAPGLFSWDGPSTPAEPPLLELPPGVGWAPDLEHVDTRPLDRAWATGFVREHLWTVGRGDGDALELRVLDPDDLAVRAVTSTVTHEPRPTLDADGTLWISSPTQRGLRADGSVVELDLAAESWRARPLPVRPLDSGGSWRSGQ